MTVTLTPEAEALLEAEIARHGSQTPEQVVERALQALAREAAPAPWTLGLPVRTPDEAVADIHALRQGNHLGGLSIKELVNEGRKY